MAEGAQVSIGRNECGVSISTGLDLDVLLQALEALTQHVLPQLGRDAVEDGDRDVAEQTLGQPPVCMMYISYCA
ncbi:hypothetical protein PF005_g27749 [Phytophthora fragariae]|uniref:Uncharacterized protein n=1 Tax=Phytophthora fragariae TaxID=53985 RepID=A0A6A3QDU2_9STRA|nr:hypothetical protein PF003_g22431 [Phytophthora fragariae]KAE8921701.1 hypothetical protein PF009_g28023 [Phytophthora fragariae]KAE9067169.1 hypothetical protein PF010_g27575 [Phytophthora fragariae]KAE9074542.1 hypothetical protein PF006_g28519 [Phytophthora fragariae]KAE9169959.1 hypothetical protein PF005_g27749 [Phytophthora fragariae]